MVYTAQAARDFGVATLENMIRSRVIETNKAYVDSRVRIDLNLLAVRQVGGLHLAGLCSLDRESLSESQVDEQQCWCGTQAVVHVPLVGKLLPSGCQLLLG